MSQQKKEQYNWLLMELVAEMLSYFLPGAEFITALNTQALKPPSPQSPLRANKVYKIQYRGQPHVLHLEFELKGDNRLAYWMLSYHALLLEEYSLPVISMIIYLFHTSIVRPPLEEKSGDETVLTFHYRPFLLWKLDARHYIKKHVIAMYPLLPVMQGVNVSTLLQALEEMKEIYEGEELSRRLLWFHALLGQVETIPLIDKRIIEREIHMFDELLENDPYVQEREERAVIQALQNAVVEIVKGRFPTLVDLARMRVAHMSTSMALYEFVGLIATAPDENSARWLLHPAAV